MHPVGICFWYVWPQGSTHVLRYKWIQHLQKPVKPVGHPPLPGKIVKFLDYCWGNAPCRDLFLVCGMCGHREVQDWAQDSKCLVFCNRPVFCFSVCESADLVAHYTVLIFVLSNLKVLRFH